MTALELTALRSNLPQWLRQRRHLEALSMHDAAQRIGIAAATVHRIEHGKGYDVDTLLAVLTWLETPPPFT